jgi:hypothetical protein
MVDTIMRTVDKVPVMNMVNVRFLITFKLVNRQDKSRLKVLTNEKSGGLKVVAFDRSPFKILTLRFSSKSV